jgi:phosphoglucomutase
MKVNELAGRPAPAAMLADIPALLKAYDSERPDPAVAAERVSFGTSGHRGSSLSRSFNEWHILAISQAIAEYRTRQGIAGPLFLGIDTHALSEPAFRTALEVLAANSVQVMIADRTPYTPTPAISHAILTHNRDAGRPQADGIVITPSHNPPEDGGFKYNPPTGGPAPSGVTRAIQDRANELLENGLRGVARVPFETALCAPTTHRHDFIEAYTADLAAVLDLEVMRGSSIRIGVDPLGGAGVDYWEPIAARYGLNLTVVNKSVDPVFGFMTLDWDGKIRMDPSSPYAMQSLIGLKDKFDIAFGCDTDHDRHGIVTPGVGLLPANHYLAACVRYLFENRAGWRKDAGVGKTVVSSSMIDRVAVRLGRRLYEVPVGFKWFVDGLLGGWLGYSGEESAGASFLRRNGEVWSTDKDGITAALLAAEITARTGRDPGELYRELTSEFGDPAYERMDAPATVEQKAILQDLTPEYIRSSELAGEKIRQALTKAPGDSNAIGGVKVVAENGWFAARPSGTEEIYKIYAESFRGREHLARIQEEAQEIVRQAFEAAGGASARG